MQEIMNQKDDVQADDKERKLEEAKKKKEEYKDPLDNLLVRNANKATFSNDVRRDTDPGYIFIVAAALAAAAVIAGVRGIMEMRRKKK